MTFVPLDAADLVWMRQDETASLIDTCTIQRVAGTLVAGSPTKAGMTPATVHANVPCRMAYRRDTTGLEADAVLLALQQQLVVSWHLIVPYGTDLQPDDQVIAGDGKTYLVLGVSTVRSLGTKLTAIVKEIGA